jgi:hypothetical protein
MRTGKIYKLVSNVDGDNNVYVGKTENTLTKRKSQHKSSSIKKPDRRVYQTFNHTNWDNVSIVLVETVLFDTVEEFSARERYWIDTISTLNKVKPGRTAVEYHQDNKERIKEQQKQYYEQNKDRISEKHNCHCGGRFTTQKQSRHFKSNKHIQFMASLALSQEQRIPPV